MPLSINTYQAMEDSIGINTWIRTEEMSHTFGIKKRLRERFKTAGSTAVTIDLSGEFLRLLLEWKGIAVQPINIQFLEVEDWGESARRIYLLEKVYGLLNELTPDQRNIFDASVKRRPLFK